jgi:glyoxylase-like metal-dependent hydrolase (beta-lactamase superfamily II)
MERVSYSQYQRRDAFGQVAPGVFGLRIAMVNVWGIQGPDGWVLVDAGLYFAAWRIREWAAANFGEGIGPRAILLTHGHFDHIGSLEQLLRHWDVPVFAHPLEMPYLTGRSAYPPPDPRAGGGLLAQLSPVYPRGPINLGERVQSLFSDGSVPYLPGWRSIHTPGHTPGHVSFFRDGDKTLIAGDAFVTTRQESLFFVLSQKMEIHGPPAYYTSDWTAAGESVRRLAALEPAVMACGHGVPVSGPDALRDLESLAHNFTRQAIPRKGRYAELPAIADERGVVWVPPAPAKTMPKVIVAGAALGGLAWMLASRRRSRLGSATSAA